MSSVTATAPDVFSAREIARAAGVSRGEVQGLMARGGITTIDGRFVATADAVRAVRYFRGLEPAGAGRQLFSPHGSPRRSPGRALAASGALHAAMLGVIALVTSWGVRTAATETPRPAPTRMVFLATPGPGGGGGGGGLRQPTPPARAEMKGTSPLRSPIPRPRPITTRPPDRAVKPALPPPVRPRPVEKPIDPPPPAPAPEPMPQVVAPVATVASDTRDRAGVLESAAEAPGNGRGSGGGAGSGTGTGMGEGDGSGVGPGSGGGTGGGPYRPGSGITPPAIVREVKPEYTEDARRRGVEGDVVLEIVVRHDGSVGTVRLLQGLGAGLDERAIDAVRQWRFSPAHRYGTPVDVMVEVAVEFKLR